MHLFHCDLKLDRDLARNTPPKLASLGKIWELVTRKYVLTDDKLFRGGFNIRNSQNRRVGQLMRIRVASLKERGKSAGITLVDEWARFLNSVDPIPLSLCFSLAFILHVIETYPFRIRAVFCW